MMMSAFTVYATDRSFGNVNILFLLSETKTKNIWNARSTRFFGKQKREVRQLYENINNLKNDTTGYSPGIFQFSPVACGTTVNVYVARVIYIIYSVHELISVRRKATLPARSAWRRHQYQSADRIPVIC